MIDRTARRQISGAMCGVLRITTPRMRLIFVEMRLRNSAVGWRREEIRRLSLARTPNIAVSMFFWPHNV